MKLNDAITERIEQLKKQQQKKQYQLSRDSTVPQTTLISIKKGRSKSVEVKTIFRLCEGLNMELKDFFDSPLFYKANIDFE